MAKPRVFLSSTYYDLRQVRTDLEHFIKEIGFEPVLHERGQVPYESDSRLDDSCYREISSCDMLVSIIGGRYGSPASGGDYSVSQQELRTALDEGKQVFIFVDRNVLGEYKTFESNKGNADVKYHYADNAKIYVFLSECYALPMNNQIHGFESAQDVVAILREQWAGLFQRYLQRAAESNKRSAVEQRKALQEIEATAKTLKELVSFLSKEKQIGDKAIHHILMTNHPIFDRLKRLLGIQYRVFFESRDELTAWLRARHFSPVEPDAWDSPDEMEWVTKGNTDEQQLLKVHESVFSPDGKLRVVRQTEWKDEWVRLVGPPSPKDDIPF